MKKFKIILVFALLMSISFTMGTNVYADDYACGGVHTINESDLQDANFTECNGGFKEDYYMCPSCNRTFNSEGIEIYYVTGNENHTPGVERYPACLNVYGEDFYKCTACNIDVDALGKGLEPTNDPVKHNPDLTELYEKDYTECCGGYKSDYYLCIDCYTSTDAEGYEIKWFEGNGEHIPGSELHSADYTECGGGFKDYYICEICGTGVDANGKEVEWIDGTGKHTPGNELHPADYTECGGGYKQAYYTCVDCLMDVDAQGNEIEWFEGNDNHVKGEKHEANFTECGGGFKEDFYTCSTCDTPLKEDGSVLYEWYSGDDKHTIVYQPEIAATIEKNGNLAFWYCEVCGTKFKDKEGKEEIENFNKYILPKLTKVDTSDTTGNTTKAPNTGDALSISSYIALISAFITSAIAIYISSSRLVKK